MYAYHVRAALSVIVRLICVAFVVLAAFAVPNAWSLTSKSDYVLEGSTLYVPLQICEPRSISFGLNNTVVNFFDDEPQSIAVDVTNSTGDLEDNDTQNLKNDVDDVECHTLDNLINACVLSILFAMAATLIFFLFDALAYYKKVRAGVAMGMSLFLVFILVMAAASCYAMYEEMVYWEEHLQKRFDDLDNLYGVDEVRMHGNKFYIAVAFVLALIAAGALLVDTLVIFCCGENVRPAPAYKPATAVPPSEQATAAAANAPSDSGAPVPLMSSSEEEGEVPPMGSSAGSKPAWTNV